MIRTLKNGRPAAQVAEDDQKVRTLVEDILKTIGEQGDAAVREYSERFDRWSPQNFRLTRAEIDACYQELPEQASRTSVSPRRRCATSRISSATRRRRSRSRRCRA
jgi:histidinol dehydrogenase